MESEAVPEFVTVTDLAVADVPTVVEVKVREVAPSVTAGAARARPLPDKLIVCAFVLSAVRTLSVALLVPVAEGLKVTEMTQLAPPASVEAQVVV